MQIVASVALPYVVSALEDPKENIQVKKKERIVLHVVSDCFCSVNCCENSVVALRQRKLSRSTQRVESKGLFVF
jgi:hypothetical protein